MERKGGCCIAPRYGAAAAAGQQAGAAWQMGRIMLKFRPIAPKPAAMAPVPTPAPVPAAATGRGKRKAVGGGSGGGGRRGRKPKRAATVAPAAAAAAAAPVVPAVVESRKDKECEKEKSLSSRSSSSSGMTSVDSSPPPLPQPTTLPLMPVSPVEEKPPTVAAAAAATGEPASVVTAPPAAAQPAPPRALRPVPLPPTASWVTVEEVTATWRDGEEAPSSAARCADGDGDAAPAFVSDQWGRVTWQNAAFARAVSADDESATAVALAGALPAWGTCSGFTCRVRVGRHASTPAARRSSVVAPCDVWRLDAAGCYLWRLDLQAALTLGGLP
jgi:hypothetical protein